MIKVLLLLAGAVLVVFFLSNRRKARAKAGVKIGFVLFVVFMVYAVIRPDDLTWVANRLGVQRGTDLVLYALVMGFFGHILATKLGLMRPARLEWSSLKRTLPLAVVAGVLLAAKGDLPVSYTHLTLPTN